MSDKKQKLRRAEAEPKTAAPKVEPAAMFKVSPPLKPIVVEPGPIASQFIALPAPLAPPIVDPNLKAPVDLAGCFKRAVQEIDPNIRTVGMVDLAGVLNRLAELIADVKR